VQPLALKNLRAAFWIPIGSLVVASAAVFAQGAWSARAEMPTGRFGAPAAVVDGRLYVASGCCVTQFSPFTRFTALEVYDSASNTWATTASIPIGVYGAAVGAIGHKVYVAGGQQASGNIATLQIYDTVTDTWTTGANMPAASVGGASGVIDGKLYVVGGMNASNTSTVATLRMYDPVADTWTEKKLMPTPRVFAAGAVFGGKLYVIGGQNGPNLSTVEVYDPQSDTWTTKAPMPTARWGLVAATIGDRIYAVGGNNNGAALNTVEVYDPFADSWSAVDPMPSTRYLPGAAVIDDTLYVVGGGREGGPGGSSILVTANEAFTPLAPNLPPTADAGLDQTLHVGTPVSLNGSDSFDDNTPTSALAYAWSFASKPAGSIAVLSGANSSTPTFVPDLPGDYLVQLVVTDEEGLPSPADTVMISSTNQAPTANAGSDQLVVLSNLVSLNGSGSDPDNDSIGFSWTLSSKPIGSSVQLTNANTATPTFVPDVPGSYVADLVVNDGFADSAPDAVQVTVISAADFSQMQIQQAADALAALPATSVTTTGNQNALMNFLSQAVQFIQAGDLDEARHKLDAAIARTDGCAVNGSPDGNGQSRDWITTCEAQDQVYPALVQALAAITP
jgi:N-acetylneuraminic acid mutarotase